MSGRRGRIALLVGVIVIASVGLGLGVASAAGLNLASQAFTPYRTCTITGTPSTTTAVADASVRQNNGTTNYGTATTNNIATGNGANRRLYMRFDLSVCNPVIPSTATIRLATLRMYVTAMPTSCRTVDIFRVTASWAESTITWNNQPFGTAINSPAKGSASDTYTVGTPAGCQNLTTNSYIVGAVLTSDVASFVGGTATNYGWMLRDDVEGSASTLTQTYSAKNLGTVGQAPQLVVTYVVAP